MADDTLTLSLDSGGDVVIKLRPDLAPGQWRLLTPEEIGSLFAEPTPS